MTSHGGGVEWKRRRKERLRSGPAYLDATGTVRRLRALVACGWSFGHLSTEAGFTRRQWAWGISRQSVVTRDTAVRVKQMYERLWNLSPPCGTPRERASMVRALTVARANRWAKPMEWDDSTI